ncbi:AMP-binding protein [Mycolicibacterium neoaurum]|uniref:AMP-binding protein n=1 Tax=Mycolicibacterium neoaurum TaxID=1795 RepID=UPI00248A9761|nr:AMP-binding protein [Mycolicibacterium neoaurum]WBP92743.1 AMP-binding protein [Mycolicibacterium neoaurum]WBS06305.1 AMP-binding protein [Mycolicibacterium neoaurum]
MTPADQGVGLGLSRSQQNIYHGVLQDGGTGLYLVGRSYRFVSIGRQRFLSALRATIRRNPIQLCVLTATDGYPVLTPRLDTDDLITLRPWAERKVPGSGLELTWNAGILNTPLVRHTVWTDDSGDIVIGLDLHCHHLLIDGAGTAIVESTLGALLAAGTDAAVHADDAELAAAFAALDRAHDLEAELVENARVRFGDAVRAELTAQARDTGAELLAADLTGGTAKGVLIESVSITGDAFESLQTLAEAEQLPINVLAATAALAVDAGRRQSTDALIVHTVDNRFGTPDLNVATCLVNSIAHRVRFAPFASVADVARNVDRAYVKALRRRWLREEQYRRMFLAINHASQVAALALNYLPAPCSPELRKFLVEPAVTTDIGPVESMSVAVTLDDRERRLVVSVWDRAESSNGSGVAECISGVLAAMPAMWNRPLAMTVGQWRILSDAGTLRVSDELVQNAKPPFPAWFSDPDGAAAEWIGSRGQVRPWISWLLASGVAPGDVLVLTDDGTDASIDLLVGCHLVGCAYSVCADADQLAGRARAIGEATSAIVHTVDVASRAHELAPDTGTTDVVAERLRFAAQDVALEQRVAYIMPTSGSTGAPKLVPVTHGALALFCDAARRTYGWNRDDAILQCSPLTSDISVEEIFVAAVCGARVSRSAAIRNGDLVSFAWDLARLAPTVVDLPTAIWHLLCDDHDAVAAVGSSSLRQIVIGGEAVRPAAVDKWVASGAARAVELISTYGPTETTVVVTALPLVTDGQALPAHTRARLGRPILPGSICVAFGEIVVLGELVSTGYLDQAADSFGSVVGVVDTAETALRTFATADRIAVDCEGFPCFAGRRDAIVKVGGKRIDTAELVADLIQLPQIRDIAVELDSGRLLVLFQTNRTSDGDVDEETARIIRRRLGAAQVPTSVVLAVRTVPRRPNGKVDSARLRELAQSRSTEGHPSASTAQADALAALWSRQLGRPMAPQSSLLDEGIGSLDLIRILPATRRQLGRNVTILDLISADNAVTLVEGSTTGWMDEQTRVRIEQDMSGVLERAPVVAARARRSSGQPILVLGASGCLGTGFGSAVYELAVAGALHNDVVLATRSDLPEASPWSALRGLPGVRFEALPLRLGEPEMIDLIRRTGAATVINSIGNANMVVPYDALYAPNVEIVAALVDACVSTGARLVHMSTYSIADDVTAARVLDPRSAPYPYAASKALAELIIAGSPEPLDYTMVRLPRILPVKAQLAGSADILVAVVDACRALGVRPAGAVHEQVTTAVAAAHSILTMSTVPLGRGISVLRGETVSYADLLDRIAPTEVAIDDFRQRLDVSDWSRLNSRRWSVVDGWFSLGEMVGNRTYAEYLAQYPAIDLNVRSIVEVGSAPGSIRDLLCPESGASTAMTTFGKDAQ